MKKVIQLLAFTLVLLALVLPVTVFADVGPKPSLHIFVKNFNTKDYYLDVLVQGERIDYSDLNRNYTEEYKELELYKYNKDGWLAKHIRYHLLFGDLKGKYDENKDMMVHNFSYHGVPHTFKIIIQEPDGNLYVSDVITTNQFNSNVILDRKTGEIEAVKGVYIDLLGNDGGILRTVVISMLLTILIELLIAIPFKIRPLKVVIWVNAATQLFLHTVLLSLFFLRQYSMMNTSFLVLEVCILVLEYFLYKKFADNVKKERLISYVIVANLSTFLLGLIIQI